MRSGYSSAVFMFLLFTILFTSESASATSRSSSPPNKKKLDVNKPCKRFVFYYHDILYHDGQERDNVTAVFVTNESKIVNSSQFGKVVVFDDPITADQNLHSPPIARAQGIYMYDMRTDFSAYYSFTLIFNSTQHKGTLNIAGSDLLAAPTRDLSITGGTGDFFMTRGICTISTEAIEGIKYFRLKMDVKLYECY